MNKIKIDIDAILAPIPGENPAGEDLRYTSVYDEIKEARRADDVLDQGDWQHEVKTSDWDKVIKIAVDALTQKTKDLQIAAWLTEGLIKIEGFNGLKTGIKILTGFLTDYWDHVYPEIEDEDLDFRVGPLEFINDKLWLRIRQIPITDPHVTSGYSWIKWQESRQVGYESDTKNKYGDVDENKKKTRDGLIAEGKLTAEDFDSAVALSTRAYYESLSESLSASWEAFQTFDGVLDEKFGANAPRMAEFKSAVEDCQNLVSRLLKDKRDLEPEPEPEAEPQVDQEKEPEEILSTEKTKKKVTKLKTAAVPESRPQASFAGSFPATPLLDAGDREIAMWNNALEMLKSAGLKKALEQLLGASCSVPSVRERNRYRLLVAKLCLKAERPDLARPIVEELNTLIEELNLERWESPIWIAEVLDALYQCLTSGEPFDEDLERARVLFRKLCTTDVTKAMIYRN
ncbi:MAG: type VI secretion system protein TssA [Desulfobacterales bacterium]|nr:type VI secretion system protein TssA [Desulfobacterales bacterium]